MPTRPSLTQRSPGTRRARSEPSFISHSYAKHTFLICAIWLFDEHSDLKTVASVAEAGNNEGIQLHCMLEQARLHLLEGRSDW